MHVSNKCSIAIHCLIFIHEYGTENKVTSELLSLSTGCNPVTIRGILSALKKSGVLYVKSGKAKKKADVPDPDADYFDGDDDEDYLVDMGIEEDVLADPEEDSDESSDVQNDDTDEE